MQCLHSGPRQSVTTPSDGGRWRKRKKLRCPCGGHCEDEGVFCLLFYARLPLMMSAAFSAIAMVGALVLDERSRGMMELSHKRRPSMPRTLRFRGSTTAISSTPIL